MVRYEAYENVYDEWVIYDNKKGNTVSWTGALPLTFDSRIEAEEFIKEQVEKYGYV